MGLRSELHDVLAGLLGDAERVYFQPPPRIQFPQYPVIVYHLDDVNTEYAGNRPYNRTKSYRVTVIDRDPDSPVADAVGELPMSSFQTWYTSDSLNHFVHNVFF